MSWRHHIVIADANSHLVGIERVGAWWLGYPIIALFLVTCAVVTFFFTKWFTPPAWLLRRKDRVKQKAIDNRIRKLTKQQKLKQKKREERHSEVKSQPQRDKRRTSSRRSNASNERNKNTRNSIRSNNSSQSGSARVPMDVIRTVQKADGNADVPPHYKDQELSTSNGVINEALEMEETEAPVTVHHQNGAMSNLAFEDDSNQNTLTLSGVVRDSTSDDNRMPSSGDIEVLPDVAKRQSESRASRRKRHEERKLQKQIKREIQNIENTQTYKRQKKYIFRSEQCKGQICLIYRSHITI